MATLFITVDKLVKDTPLNGSLDTNLASPLMLTAQDREIWPWLGTDLYEKLKSDVEGSSVSGVYETLLKTYVQPALAWYSLAYILPHLRVRLSNNAVQIMSSEQSEPASERDVDRLIDTAKNNAAFYRERMIDYLCHNSSSYPEYNTNTGDDIHPRTRNYSGGLYLGESRSRRAEAFLRDAGFKDV